MPGLLAHQAGDGPDGFVVVDVWESEEAFARFGELVAPIMHEVGSGFADVRGSIASIGPVSVDPRTPAPAAG